MSTYVAGGGKIDQEGFLKEFLLSFRPGYSQGLNLTQRGAGANMSVDVNLNGSYAGGLLNTSANVPYVGWIDAVTNVSVTTSSPSNPRIDTVVAYVDLSAISSAVTNNVGAFKFLAVAGTPAGSPVAPNGAAIQTAIGAGNPYITLGNLAIATSAASVVNANITDTRVPSALAVPYLYGGSSNTNGHRVPNQADGTVVTTTDTNSVAAAMLSTSAITLGYVPVAGPIGNTNSSPVLITGLTSTVTIPAGGRKVKITASLGSISETAATGITVTIWDGGSGVGMTGGTQVGVAQASIVAGMSFVSVTAMAVVTPSAGSKTYNVAIACGSGTVTVSNAFILVEAI